MDELSVSATLVPRVKRAVQSLAIPDCQELVSQVLELDTSSAILGSCTAMAQKYYGDLLA
jgi:phosphoenolpyruvate-protein kinase (PTS system EI component)